MSSTLLRFYYGGFPDDHGRMLAEITRQDDLWLEMSHDYIQWLFPLREHSRVTPGSPLITDEVERAFREDDLLQRHLFASLIRMLSFFGLTRSGNEIIKGPNWSERKADWFVHDTHNNLRITRILKSLAALSLSVEASKFLRCLEHLRASEPDCGIGETAFSYWREALTKEERRP